MFSDFKEFIKSCESKRIDEVYKYIYELDEIAVLRKQKSKLFQEVASLLPEDKKRVLIEFDDAHNETSVRTSDICYRQGLRDGLRVCRLLRMYFG